MTKPAFASQVQGLALSGLLAFMLPVSATSSARARDVEMIARVLIPAYMAQNFAAVCVANDPGFVESTASVRGHVHLYVKHVKDEAVADLTEEEVEAVLRMSANAAKAVVQNELRGLSAITITEEGKRLTEWCEYAAKPYVRDIMTIHFAKHEEVDRILSEAKRN